MRRLDWNFSLRLNYWQVIDRGLSFKPKLVCETRAEMLWVWPLSSDGAHKCVRLAGVSALQGIQDGEIGGGGLPYNVSAPERIDRDTVSLIRSISA
jgi:hypothetical protein